MVHILVVDHHVVLGCHVVSNVVVHDQPEKSVEKGEINLLVEFLKLALHHDGALAVPGLPDVLQVVDALTPLVGQQWWGLAVTRLDPGREESPLVSLVPGVERVNVTTERVRGETHQRYWSR